MNGGNGGNGGNGHSDGEHVVVLTERLAPEYVPMRDAAAMRAPVLELEGIEPWAEIPGPTLTLEETEQVEPAFESDDPAQLVLEPAGEADADDAGDTVAEAPASQFEEDEPAFLDGSDEESASAAVLDAPAAEVPAAEAPATEAAAPAEPPPPDPAEILYGEAHAAADAGRTDEAKRLYRQLLASHPAHVRARNNLALILDAEGNHQGALAELDRALDADPENGTLLVNRGALLGAMGRYAAAERDLRKVLRVEPSHAEALFNLGVVMTKKGLWCEAVPQLKRAVELEPERGAAHYYLGEALNHVDDLAGALAAYQRAAELQPSNPRALYGLGIIYDRLARPDDAALMYRRSREVGRR